MKTHLDSSLIDLRGFSKSDARWPLLIAHRGGVIAANAPENSLTAIQLAGDRAYDMVELDVVEAKDCEPVLFHGWKGHLGRDCGLDAYVYELTSKELTGVYYRESDQRIATLSMALELCRELNLGVMLDIKTFGPNLTMAHYGGAFASYVAL
jgi:glycerophosphoryl diester phosphodiesterase